MSPQIRFEEHSRAKRQNDIILARKKAEEKGEDFDEQEYKEEQRKKEAMARPGTGKKGIEKDTVWMKDEYVPATSFIHTLAVEPLPQDLRGL